MVIESGVIIFIGLLLLFIKLPKRTLLRLLNHAFLLDLSVSVLAYILHYGTFTGVMAAAVAGLMCSSLTFIMKRAVGYIKGRVYYPGYWKLNVN